MSSTDDKKPRGDQSGLFLPLLASWDVWQQSDEWWRARCPIHKGDNPSAFSINRSGYFKCFRCSAGGDIYELLRVLQGLPYTRAKALVDAGPTRFSNFFGLTELPEWKTRHRGAEEPALPESTIYEVRSRAPLLLLQRGFSAEMLKRYHIGYNQADASVVLPVRDAEGRLIGLTYRADYQRPGQPKYWHDNFMKARHLYGFHLWAGKEVTRLFLVEGHLDVVRLAQLGHAACGVMGSELSAQQIDLLQKRARCKQLVLMLDNDDAGRAGTAKAVSALGETRFMRQLGVAEYATHDPGDLTVTDTINIKPWFKRLTIGRRHGTTSRNERGTRSKAGS